MDMEKIESEFEYYGFTLEEFKKECEHLTLTLDLHKAFACVYFDHLFVFILFNLCCVF